MKRNDLYEMCAFIQVQGEKTMRHIHLFDMIYLTRNWMAGMWNWPMLHEWNYAYNSSRKRNSTLKKAHKLEHSNPFCVRFHVSKGIKS